jgi:hypothetical protein
MSTAVGYPAEAVPSMPYPQSPNEGDAPFPPVHQPTPQRIHGPIPREPIHPELPEGPVHPDPEAVPRRNVDASDPRGSGARGGRL